MTFYFSKNSKMYNGSFTLSSYLPGSDNQYKNTWVFNSVNENDWVIYIDKDVAEKMQRKIEYHLEYGECVNLTTKTVTKL